jgi:motility quorum-sensing regulator/GCU-specific mRNA interferase toxin
MEKGVPHYSLAAMQKVVEVEEIKAFTHAAEYGALGELELTEEEAVQVILCLTRSDFYKSMTTHADHRVWQDVYHAPCPNGRMAYIKLTLQDNGIVVIQFKEL